MMMMMMIREANRTRDAMIELSPPQKTDTNTRVKFRAAAVAKDTHDDG